MTRRIHRIFSCRASFHCQSGRRTMSMRAKIMKTSEPRMMAIQTMKKMVKAMGNAALSPMTMTDAA